MDLDEALTRLYTYRVRKTVLQMLNDRGYLVMDEEMNQSKDEFEEKCGEDPKSDDMSKKKRDSDEQILVFFPDSAKSDQGATGKVGVKQIKTYVEVMNKGNIRRAIMVVTDDLTPSAKSCLGEIASKGYLIEVFQEAEMVVNISHHVHVPKHTLLTEKEKQELLERYTVTEAQLPRIKSSDPIARYYGLQRGQVVKIVRPSETAGQYVTYRYVV